MSINQSSVENSCHYSKNLTQHIIHTQKFFSITTSSLPVNTKTFHFHKPNKSNDAHRSLTAKHITDFDIDKVASKVLNKEKSVTKTFLDSGSIEQQILVIEEVL